MDSVWLMLGKFSTVIRSKSFSHKGLGRTRPARRVVSPYLTTTYEQNYFPKDSPLTMPIYMV
jgi:hypothetical protein